MNAYLLSPENIRELRKFCQKKTLFAFDYDGTLAPICPNPDEAHLSPVNKKLLLELSSLCATAIITGRAVDDVRRFLPMEPSFLVGNHGAEGTQTREEQQRMEEHCWIWKKRMETVSPILKDLGVTMEDKSLSLTFHYRHSPDPEVAEGVLEFLLSTLPDCRITKGKFVFNVLPEISLDKGVALELLMKRHGFESAVYFGDDVTDEDVFEAKIPGVMSVKIGQGKTRAKYFLQAQYEMSLVLKELVQELRKGSGSDPGCR